VKAGEAKERRRLCGVRCKTVRSTTTGHGRSAITGKHMSGKHMTGKHMTGKHKSGKH